MGMNPGLPKSATRQESRRSGLAARPRLAARVRLPDLHRPPDSGRWPESGWPFSVRLLLQVVASKPPSTLLPATIQTRHPALLVNSEKEEYYAV